MSTSQQMPEISLLPTREQREKHLKPILNHPLNRLALQHMKALKIDNLQEWLPIIQLAQWAILEQPDECTYQKPQEAELTMAEWSNHPRAAMDRVLENTRLDDFADMEPQESAVYLMLSLTAPESE